MSATIIVCEANDFMSKLHDWMPVILDAAEIGAWLADPRPDLLRLSPNEGIRAWKVNPKVNSSRYSDPDAVASIEG